MAGNHAILVAKLKGSSGIMPIGGTTLKQELRGWEE